MNIVIVGGNDCMHCQYKEICKKYGCRCKVFTHCPANFQNQIGSPEMIVVFTKTVAHKMVKCACRQAEKTGSKIQYVNSSSANALCEVLARHFEVA